MKKSLFVCAVLTVFTVSPSWSQGFLSSIRGRFGGEASPNDQAEQVQQSASQVAQATPAPAETATKSKQSGKGKSSVKIIEGTPPPTENAQPAPDKEAIRKGAARLKSSMVPERVPGDLFSLYSGTWNGTLNVYSPTGDVLETHAVVIECRPSGKSLVKETYYVDRNTKQPVLAETATYTNEGSAVSIVSVSPEGNAQQRSAKYNDRQLFITGQAGSGLVHFRERFSEGRALLVDGFDYRGGTTKVHVGRYTRQR